MLLSFMGLYPTEKLFTLFDMICVTVSNTVMPDETEVLYAVTCFCVQIDTGHVV